MSVHVVIISGTRNDLSSEEQLVINAALQEPLKRVTFDKITEATNTIVFHGNHRNPRGVDRYAAELFARKGALIQKFDAPWRLGAKDSNRTAGPLRNEWLRDSALRVRKYYEVASITLYCFPRVSSTGSINMITCCTGHPIDVEINYVDGTEGNTSFKYERTLLGNWR